MMLGSRMQSRHSANCGMRCATDLILPIKVISRTAVSTSAVSTTTSKPRVPIQHRWPTDRLRFGSSVIAAAAAEQQALDDTQDQQGDDLAAFLTWLIANGVEGIGGGNSKVGLYEAEGGERGLASTQDIKEGDVLLRVPLRMAFTDYPTDEESNKLMYEGAPWSVRLSAKLLREVAKGIESPWFPYIKVLPKQVPAPLEVLSWDEMKEIEYGPAQKALHEYNWLVTDAYASCDPASIGHATAEQFQWAMSIVHSRCFGNAAKGGGVGVRMLVPLIDMVNHGGDETAGLLSDPFMATDSLRWDVVAPSGDKGAAAGDSADSAGWHMVVTATQDVPKGCALLFSYGERSGDDFFLHYGFVPALNPHEEVELFANVEEALEWHYEQYGSKMSRDEAQSLYAKALEAAIQEQKEEQDTAKAAAAAAASSSDDGSPAPAATTPDKPSTALKVLARACVNSPLVTAFMGVSTAADEQAKAREAELAIARRCWHMLAGMRTPLTADLAILWKDAAVSGDAEQAPIQSLLLQHYHQEIAKSGYATLSAAVCEPFTGTPAGPKPKIPGGGPPKVPTVQLAEHYLGSARPTIAAELPLMHPQRTVVKFRAAKKLLLWDILFKARASVEDLGPAPAVPSQAGEGGAVVL